MSILTRSAHLTACAAFAAAVAAPPAARAEHRTEPVTAAAPADYPLEAVLTAARELCAAASTVHEAVRGPLPASWKVVTPPAGSWLGTYLGENRKVVSGFTSESRALVATVQGRPLEAIVNTIHGPPSQREATNCEVIDRTAVFSPDNQRIARWAGRPPRLGRDVLPGLTGWIWKPGLEPASQETLVNYVTASAAQSAGLRRGLTYLAITLARQPSK